MGLHIDYRPLINLLKFVKHTTPACPGIWRQAFSCDCYLATGYPTLRFHLLLNGGLAGREVQPDELGRGQWLFLSTLEEHAAWLAEEHAAETFADVWEPMPERLKDDGISDDDWSDVSILPDDEDDEFEAAGS